MRRVMQGAVIGWAAMCALALSTGTALATREIEIRPNRERFTETSSAVQFASGGSRIECPVVFNGVLTRSAVSKAAAGSLVNGTIAAITSARVERCTEMGGGPARVTFLIGGANGEMLVRYDGWAGTLPAIRELLVTKLRFAYSITYSFIECLYEGSLAFFVTEVPRGGSDMNWLEGSGNVSLVRGSALCPATETVSATFILSPVWRLALL